MKEDIPVSIAENFPVTSAHIDFKKQLKVSSLIDMFIQAAWHHAEKLDFGMNFLHENGAVWMLSRMRVRFNGNASWNEEVLLKTWPKGIYRVFYQRDFEAYNSADMMIASGTSEWLIIDVKARRPKLYKPNHHVFNLPVVNHAIDSAVPVLAEQDTPGETFCRKVRYSDIDLNEHLTTTRYIDWIFDTFSSQFLREHSCSELIINFVKEIPLDSEVVITRHHLTNKSFGFEFRQPGNDTVHFRACIDFR